MNNGTQILFENKNGTCCIRLKNGKFKRVTLPEFKHKQIVRTSPKHFSQTDFTMVLEPSWTEKRGWVYGERYIDRDSTSGGSGYWQEEDKYEFLENPLDILIAKRLSLKDEKKSHESWIKIIDSELQHLNYAIKEIGL